MTGKKNSWALVLAAGEGSRLRCLTTTASGIAIPKQFCSLNGDVSLLQETVERARTIIPEKNITAIVAEQHAQWWRPTLKCLPVRNRITQPQNRGTGIGILLPLLKIINRDPKATIVLLPSDHFVRDERPLRRSLAAALNRIGNLSDEILMLGIEPDQADTELGYIVPGASDGDGVYLVDQFVEKPKVEFATQLLRQGALWNSFIIVAGAQSLLGLFAKRFPEVVQPMIDVLATRGPDRRRRLRRLYEQLPDIDFSRHVVSGAEQHLRVLPVPRCGWSDLGTPRRVGEVVARLERRVTTTRRHATSAFNLAVAHNQLQMAG